jgi:hypothetical protein
MAEQVTIKINVKADTAAIERLRAQLKSLCREADDCSDTFDKYSKGLNTTSTSQKKLTNTTDDNSSAIKRLSGATRGAGNDNRKFGKSMGMLSKVGKFFGNMLMGVAKLGFKYLAIEAALAAAVIASSVVWFKVASASAKGYQMAVAGAGYALTVFAAAGSAFLAAQEQFASVQFAPMFTEGLVNTSDKFEAANLAMKSFVNDSQLAVFGTKALSGAFAEMAKNLDGQKLGQATGALRQMGNVAAGMGGDIGKNFGDVSKFVTSFMKEGKLTDKVKTQGEELSPIFKKVMEEQVKAGNTTYEKFMATVGDNETFKEAYGGQLDALNDTVVGRFKSAITEIKKSFTSMGAPMLGPLTKAIGKIKNLILAMLIRVRGSVEEVGSGSLLNGLIKGVEKLTLLMGRMMTSDMAQAGGAVDKIKNGWKSVLRVFEKISDYLRPLQESARVLFAALQPILGALFGNLDNTIQGLSKSLIDNKDKFIQFTTGIANFIKQVGAFGMVIKDIFISAMPFLSIMLSTFTLIFKAVTNLVDAIMDLSGPLDVIAGPMLAIAGIAGVMGGKALFKGAGGATGLLGKGMQKAGGGGALSKIGGAVATNAATMTVNAGVVNVLGGAAGAAASSAADLATGGGKAGKGGMLSRVKGFLKGPGKLAKIGKVAGPAALLAAGAYGAHKIGDFAGSKFKDNSIKSKAGGALTGAAGGAAIGAAVGSVVPVVGTAMGAVVGGIIGGVSGWFSAGKNKTKAQKAAKNMVESYTSAVDEAFADGDVDALLELKDGMLAQIAESAAGDIEVYNAEIAKLQPELDKINNRIEKFSSNAEQMAKWLGIDGDKMNELTEKFGFQFQTRFVSIFEVIGRAGEELGTDLATFFKDVIDEMNQKQNAGILDLMDQPAKIAALGKEVDASQAAYMSGDNTDEAKDKLIKDQYAYALEQTGGDAMKALALTQDMFKQGDLAGGAYEGKGQALLDRMGAGGMGLLGDSTESRQNLVNLARDSGSVSLGATQVAGLSGIDQKSAENLMLNQIATGGIDAAMMQQELVKSYALTAAGEKGGISQQDFLTGLSGGIEQLTAMTNKAMELQSYSDPTYGGGGVLMNAPVAPGSLSTGTDVLKPTTATQTITVGETKVQVSGIMSPSEAQLIANAIMKTQTGLWERIRSGTLIGKPLPVE